MHATLFRDLLVINVENQLSFNMSIKQYLILV